MDELADQHAAESAEIAANSGGDIGPAEKPERVPTLRETLNKSVEEVRERERSRDQKTGQYLKEKQNKAAPEKVAVAKESSQGDGVSAAPAKVQQETQASTPKAPAGPPPGWSPESKAFFDSLPPDHPLRQDVAKREEEVSNGFKSYSEKTKQYEALERVLAPSRTRFQQFGVQNDAEAISRLFEWEAAFANPHTKMQAFHNLAKTYGVDLSQFARQSSAPSDGSQETPDPLRPVLDEVGQLRQQVTGIVTSQQLAEQQRVASTIEAFANDKDKHPHFEKVRVAMGQLMQAGIVPPNDLEGAYQRAIWADPELRDQLLREQDEKRKAEFLKTQADAAAKARQAAVSPAPRARQAAPVNGADKSSKGVRGSILTAINELREDQRA